MSSNYDLVVIGSGPGGYVAAARAAALGLKTAIVEKDKALGGTCLHRGCIPTKALLHAADVFGEMRDSAKIGIIAEGVRVDWETVQKYKNRIVTTNAGGVSHLMKSRGVDVYNGMGKLKSSSQVDVIDHNDKVSNLNTKNILLAVGSKPRALPMADFSESRVLSSDTILNLDTIPGSLTIIGGGVIGIEFASIFVRFGTKVTVIEALPTILGNADKDCTTEMQKQLEDQGVKFHTNAKVTSMKPSKNSCEVGFTNAQGQNLVNTSDYVLVSIGRAPLTENIGLEKTKVKLERGFVVTNQFMQSAEPNIYAIGDCVNTPWLAHVASAEGIVAVEHIAQASPQPINYQHIPSCVYSDPPMASCGLTEADAKAQGYEIKIGKFDFARSGKASILGVRRGFIKFVSDAKYGEILGVHIVGPDATELLAEPAFAMQLEATIDDVARTMHAHPTLYESIYEAAAVATGRAIHG